MEMNNNKLNIWPRLDWYSQLGLHESHLILYHVAVEEMRLYYEAEVRLNKNDT